MCSCSPVIASLRVFPFTVGGSCYFSWKVVLAEEAGALAVIIFDTVDPQSTAVLAIAGPFQNPRTPGIRLVVFFHRMQ